MKWGDAHIGGPELGPVIFRYPEGNETLSIKYQYQGRLLLGELKKRMQLGGVKDSAVEIKLPDGTKLRAKSNQWGLADIDEVWIMPKVSASSGFRVIGYIVQGFCDEAVGTDNNRRVHYMVTLPSGDAVGYWDDYLWDEFYPYESITYYTENKALAELSDNGAKYVPYAYGKDPDTFEWLFEDPPKYQHVCLLAWNDGVYVNGYASGMYNMSTGTQNYTLIRRESGDGLFGDVGISLDADGYAIEERDPTNGHGFVFMVPQGTTRNFRNSDAIMSDLHAYWDNRGQGETIIYADKVGIPCVCKPGIHIVHPSRHNNKVTISDFSVWLLVEDLKDNSTSFHKLSYAGIETYSYRNVNTDFTGPRELSHAFHINVRAFDSLDELSSLVSLKPVD